MADTVPTHKLSWFRSKLRKSIGMLCRPSQTGKNDHPKTVNWDHVNCLRCLAFKEAEECITNLDQ